MCEQDCCGFNGSLLIKTEVEYVIITVGLSNSRGCKADILLARKIEKAEGEIHLRFLKDIFRLFFGMGIGMSMSIVAARWSEI